MAFSSNLALQLEARNGVSRIAVGGELDMASAPELAGSLVRAEQDGTHAIMLDLRDLTFMDCTGLLALLQASERAKTNRHRLVIVGASRAARQLFELTRTEHLIDRQASVGVLAESSGGEALRAQGEAISGP